MIEWLSALNLPEELITFILAMLPISELRGAIPFALGVLHMSFVPTFLISWIGSVIPGVAIVYFLGGVSAWLSRRSKYFKSFFDWLFARTYKRFWKHHQKLGSLALVIFVAIPLPVTGVWTGSVAAFLFGIPKKTAIILLGIGSFMAGIIVTLVYYGFFSFFKIFL